MKENYMFITTISLAIVLSAVLLKDTLRSKSDQDVQDRIHKIGEQISDQGIDIMHIYAQIENMIDRDCEKNN